MTTDVITRANRERVESFAAAWNRHDLDAIMAAMTDDCVFIGPAGGGGFGTRANGQAEVRDLFSQFFEAYPDLQFSDANILVDGDSAILEATQSRTESDGAKFACRGCDVLKFCDGKISVKSYYVKS
jgi:uncharacterized protein (TIGR02246 family)